MSYCRIGEDSDVYVLRGTQYEVTLTGGRYWTFTTPKGAFDHLILLREAGYTIPKRATQRLAKELL